ncbi:MAG: hypothetical protein LBO70_06650 [Clostridiales Family XIII bacterium]|jgi:uncharacterized membrane protein|nr:hypothetical protein [Clostridiales Family XIII bacterium]
MRKYTGYTYIKKLERCLRKMPYDERLDAVNYYTEYLAEAGPAHEREVIERLGPPQRLAAELRADAALSELNAKGDRAAKAKAARKARKVADRRERGAASGKPPYETRVYGGAEGSQGVQPDAMDAGDAYQDGPAKAAPDPGMGESFSAAGLGAIGMLSMPVARPLAVLACILGIMGLVIGVIVVVAIFFSAGALVVAGAVTLFMSFWLTYPEFSTVLFLAGAGAACIGGGLVIGVLNYLLGRAIFKGIANLSGRIRHKRVKIRKENFNYSYAYTNEYSYTYTDGATGTYGAGGCNGSSASYESGIGKETAQPYSTKEPTGEGRDQDHEQQA